MFQGPAQLSIVCCSTEKREKTWYLFSCEHFYPDVTHVRKDTRPSPTIPSLAGQTLSQGGSMLLSLLLVQVNCWVHYLSKLILLASWWKLRFLGPLSIFGFPHPSWWCIRNLSHTSTRLACTIKMEFHRMWESGPQNYLFCATNRKLGGAWEHTQEIMIITGMKLMHNNQWITSPWINLSCSQQPVITSPWINLSCSQQPV